MNRHLLIKQSSFAEKVRSVVRCIPRGQVLSYAQVAAYAGILGAARAVGTVMRNNFDESVPCHRVVKSTGEVGEYNRGGSEAKIQLLKQEGVVFTTKTRVHIEQCL